MLGWAPLYFSSFPVAVSLSPTEHNKHTLNDVEREKRGLKNDARVGLVPGVCGGVFGIERTKRITYGHITASALQCSLSMYTEDSICILYRIGGCTYSSISTHPRNQEEGSTFSPFTFLAGFFFPSFYSCFDCYMEERTLHI